VVWWKAAVGAAIVIFAVREMFSDLFHPTRSGALSEWIASRLFHAFRRWPSVLPTSGPLSIAVVIMAWALLLGTGFAFIYWSCFPAAFAVHTQTRPAGSEYWWWSFYYSLEMLTTLGLGDLQPNPTWLKILSACHTLLGFSLVTASITWIVLVFPALRRMRTLSRKAITLEEAERQTGVPVVSGNMHVVVAGLAEEVIQARVDLIHFPLLFYFYAQDSRASLPCALFPLRRFAEDGGKPGCDELVRLAAQGLRIALDDLAELIGDRLGCKDRRFEAVARAFAELHRPPA
jgi:hypothetical protein